MAVIFLLGPGMWGPERTAADVSPMEVRKKLAARFRTDGHAVILMEDEADRKGEDMVEKFDRLLRKATAIVMYWPPQAKMQTTYDELILLRDRKAYLAEAKTAIWVLHHDSVAEISGDEFNVLEAGNRSRYLTAVAALGVHPIDWSDDEELDRKAALLSAELKD